MGAVGLGLLLAACQTVPQPSGGIAAPVTVEAEERVFDQIENDELQPSGEGSIDRSSVKDIREAGEESFDKRLDNADIGLLLDSDFKVSFSDYLPGWDEVDLCLLYTSPSPRDRQKSRMPSSA